MTKMYVTLNIVGKGIIIYFRLKLLKVEQITLEQIGEALIHKGQDQTQWDFVILRPSAQVLSNKHKTEGQQCLFIYSMTPAK